MAVVCRCGWVGGLQDIAAVASGTNWLVSTTFITTSLLSRPGCQVSHPLFSTLPFIVFALVAASLCPSAFPLQVALLCPTVTRYPCVQQYPPGSDLRGVFARGFPPVALPPGSTLAARSVYAVESADTLAVREVMVAVSVALFSTNCANLVIKMMSCWHSL